MKREELTTQKRCPERRIRRQAQVLAAWQKHRTVAGVARELCVSWDTARLWLEAISVRPNHTGRRKRLALRKQRVKQHIWRNASWMAAAYAHLGTADRVAELAGCSRNTVSMWLVRHGVEVRKQVSRGEAHYAAKLTEDDVREIRRRYALDRTIACRERLAAEKGVSVPTVCKVVYRQSWKHVT